MNNSRRKAIHAIMDKLSDIQNQIDALKNDIISIKDEEQKYVDNIPENMQHGERCFVAEKAISNIDDAEDYVGDISNNLMYAISHLEDAMN